MNATEVLPVGDDRPLDRLLVEYLQGFVRGENPSLEDCVARLETDAERVEFRQLAAIATSLENVPHAEFKPGAVLGPYRIIGELGRGGMGVVYRALDTTMPREVAIKILNPEWAEHGLSRQQFDRERRVLAKLKHTNILTIHEAGILDGRHYLVLDLVDGTSLDVVRDRLATRQSPSLRGGDLLSAIDRECPAGVSPIIGKDENYYRAAARIVLEITRAVEAAHGVGVRHRDLTPRNVMLTGSGSPVILDFGLASSVDETAHATPSGSFAGNPGYVAPEQVENRATGNDERSDVYQVGNILYELLTRRRAFTEDGRELTKREVETILQKIRRGLFTPPRDVRPEIPKDLEAICRKAMATRVDQRYQSARKLKEDLDAFLEFRPVAARPASTSRKVALLVRRNRATAAAIALLVALPAAVIFPIRQAMAVETFRSFRAHEGQPNVWLAPHDPVFDRDIIGVELNLDAPAFVYALSVTAGGPGEPRFVQALPPQLEGLLHAGGQSEELQIQLPKGTHRLVLAKIGSAPISTTRWYEGLYVFCSSREHLGLRDWMMALSEEMKVNAGRPVALDRARQLMPTTTRGDPVLGLTADQRRLLAVSLATPPLERDDVWPFQDPKRFKIWFVKQ